MNSAKRLILIVAVGILSVVMVGPVVGSKEASAAPTKPSSTDVTVTNTSSEPVPVVPQGTVNVSGTVGLSSAANTVKLDSNAVKLDPSGNTVKLDSNTVKLDPAGNMVGLSSGANTVKLDPAGNTVKLDSAGSMTVSGSVGLSSGANTVKLDPNSNTVKIDPTGPMTVGGTVGLSPDANTVKLDSNTVKLDPSSNTVKLDPSTPMTFGGTVGLSSDANSVKLDSAYTNQNPVKVWGWVGLDPVANNTVKVINPPDSQPLLVKVVEGGAGGSAEQPVQFRNSCSTTTDVGSQCSSVAYTVPAGKILKIEYVSVTAEGRGGAEWLQANVRTTMGGTEIQHALPNLQIVNPAGPIFSTDSYRTSTQVTIYADENTNVEGIVFSGAWGNSVNGGVGAAFMYSGYLTNK